MAKEKIRLLVIDDNPKVAWMLRQGLGEEDYEIITALDGKAGIQKMIEEQPGVIILDIKLPGMDGMEVLERIRSINHRVEIVMLSGYGETKQIVRAMKLGASDFISKPFDVEEVEERGASPALRAGGEDGPGEPRWRQLTDAGDQVDDRAGGR